MINVIPMPNHIKDFKETLLMPKKLTVQKVEMASKAIKLLSKFFTIEDDEVDPFFTFKVDQTIKSNGSYYLSIYDKVLIRANSQAGFLYAIETLRQLLPNELEISNKFENVIIPKVIITDEPAFNYRGYMIDSARHFVPKDVIKEKLDQMALFKLNALHWHLSDDQGWRIDLPEYPKLKEISSKRARTKIGGTLKNPIYDEKPYEGIYSIADIKEIVEYANNLEIEIIPEIDSPGHLSALLAAYPEYSCKKEPITVKEGSGIYKDILCVGNDKAVEEVTNIILRVASLFPSKKFHIGGDEAPLDRIKECPVCKEKAKQLGLRSALELKLDYSNKLARRLIDDGYRVIGWNEITNRKLPKELIVQVWAPYGTRKAINHINMGHKGIVSNFSKFYLDYTFTMFPLKKTYEFDIRKTYNPIGQKNILGFEAPAWSEYIQDKKRLDWQTYPRLIAMAEVAWTKQKAKDYASFIERLDVINKRLDILGVNHATPECYLSKKKESILGLLLNNKGDMPSNIDYEKYN